MAGGLVTGKLSREGWMWCGEEERGCSRTSGGAQVFSEALSHGSQDTQTTPKSPAPPTASQEPGAPG